MACEWSSLPRHPGVGHKKGPALIVRSSRVLVLFFAAALVGLAMISGVLIFQLSRGPISLSFLTPLVERALNSSSEDTQIQLHDTVLTWENEDRALDVRATGLQFLDSEGRVRATIPEMTVTFSARALLRGMIAPTNLEIFGPRLKVIRAETGEVSLDFGGESVAEGEGGAPVGLIQELLRPPDLSLASGYLTGVAVRSAFVEFDDRLRGRQFVAPNTNIQLVRDAEGIGADGSVTLGEGEQSIHLGVSGIYRASDRMTDLGLVFTDITPSALARFDPSLAVLERLDTQLEGTVTLSVDASFEAIVASLDLRATAGVIDAAPLFDEPVAFEAAVLRLNGEQAQELVTLDSFEVDLGETKIALSGNGQRSGGEWAIALEAEVRDLPFNDIESYWPEGQEANAREWITENLRDGYVDFASARAQLTTSEGQPNEVSIDDVSAEIEFRDVTVHYLRPMEPVTGGAGVARIDAEKVVVDVETANLRGIVAESGRVVIDGLSGQAAVETLKIEATVAGPVRDALEVLDSEPLGFISDFGIDPARTSGSQRTNAVFALPLLQEIKVDEISVATSSRLTGFSAENAAFGFPVSNGDLTLKVNPDGLEAEGTADIGVIPVGLTWVERFNDDGELRTQYKVRTALDAQARQQLEIDTAPYVTGPVGIGLTYSEGWDGKSAGAAEIDLTESALSLDPFDWTKDVGVPGRAFVRFHSDVSGVLSVPEIEVRAADLDLLGSGVFLTGEDKFALRQLQFSRLKFGDTDAVATLELPESGVPFVRVSGNSIDVRSLMDDVFGDDTGDKAVDEDDEQTPAMRIVVNEDSPIGSVRLGEETRLLDARGVLFNDGEDWSEVVILGRLSNAGRVALEIAPEPEQLRLTFETDDAGGLLRALDWWDTIQDGEMRVLASIVETPEEGEVITGQVDAQGFVLTDEPFAAKILALTSFTGIGNILSGNGLTFRRLEVPFRLTDREIIITDAKARGADIGIITSGRVDREADTLDLTGEVAPAYTLNSLLANIPLIGQVLSGGSEGIFAATFDVSGSLDDPDVSVNPLSVLTPGLIRRLLSGFGDGDDPSDRPELPDTEGPEVPE